MADHELSGDFGELNESESFGKKENAPNFNKKSNKDNNASPSPETMTFSNMNLTVPFDYIHLEDLKISKVLNEHATANLRFLISDENWDKYINESGEKDKVEIYHGTEKTESNRIFSGVVTGIGNENLSGFHYCNVIAKSGSIELDRQENSRSFQDTTMTYTSILENITRAYDHGDIIDTLTNGEPTGKVIIQYKETDWKFFKRIASTLGGFLVPDIKRGAPKFWIGIPDGKTSSINNIVAYHFRKNVEVFNECLKDLQGLNVEDFEQYEVYTYEYHEIGELINFRDEDFILEETTGEFKDGIFVYKHILSHEGGLKRPLIINKKLKGLSLEGTITDVQKEVAKIHLKIDDGQDTGEPSWIPYASESNNMLYCMPEKGTVAHLYIPNYNAEEAIINNSINKTGGTTSREKDPGTKSLSTPTNQEMQLNSTGINLIENPGSQFINIDGASGVMAKSNSDIKISTKGKFNLKAKEDIIISCKQDLLIWSDLTQGGIKLKADEGSVNFFTPNKITYIGDKKEHFTSLNNVLDVEVTPPPPKKTNWLGILTKVLAVVAVVASVASGSLILMGLALAGAVAAFTNGSNSAGSSTLQNFLNGATSGMKTGAMIDELKNELAILEKEEEENPNPETEALIAELTKELQSLEGIYPGSAMSKDPVNLATGNFIYTKEDISILGSFPVKFERFYNSIDGDTGELGSNWCHNYEIKLEDKKNYASIKFGDGHIEKYEKDGRNYISPVNKTTKLARNGFDFSLTFKDGSKYKFDLDGNIDSIIDSNGNSIAISVLKKNNAYLQKKIKSVSGYLILTYSDDLLRSVEDETGRYARYYYKAGHLISVRYHNGAEYKYIYNEYGKLKKVINPLGVTTVVNSYDDHGRNIGQNFPDGGYMQYRYHEDSTILIEQNGNAIKYYRDEKYRITKIEHADGSEIIELDGKDQRTAYTDKNGNKTLFEYDENGNVTKVTDPLLNVTEIRYEKNKPVYTKNALKAESKFSYDKKGNFTEAIDPLGRTTKIAYDNLGLPEKIILPDNSMQILEHDNKGNIIAITDASGNTTKYEYDNLNRVIKTVNGEGYSTNFLYTTNNEIKEVTNSEGNTRKYKYSKNGFVTKIIDFDGNEINYKYNALNKIEEIKDKAGNKTKFEYDLMWNMSKVIDSNGGVTNYIYNLQNKLEKVIDAEGNTTTYSYDPNGNMVNVTDPRGNKTEIAYNERNKAIKVLEANGALSKLSYDEISNLKSMTDAMGNTTKYEYDIAGQLIKTIDALDNATEYSYNLLGQVSEIKNAKGAITKYFYSKNGKLRETVFPEGESIKYVYNHNGNIKTIEDRLKNVTEYSYDSLDRVIEIKNALGNSRYFEYDILGNVTKLIDENGNETKYVYSVMGNLIKVIDALGHSTKYDYDLLGKLTKMEQYRIIDEGLSEVTEKNTETTIYTRNKLGQITEVTNSLGQREEYKYDRNGNLTTKLDRDNFTTRYEWNSVNQLEKIVYGDGKAVEYSYSPLKQLVEMKDWLGTTKIDVDPLGRATKVVDFEDNKVEYVYNEIGERTEIRYPDHSKVKYNFDMSSRLKSVTENEDITKYAYDTLGRLKEKILPNGIKMDYDYNALGQITELMCRERSGPYSDRFKYSYDEVGNKTVIEKYRDGLPNECGKFEYGYDALNRLISVAKNENPLRNYSYDSLGNRIGMTDKGQTTNYEYNNLNQLIRIDDSLNEKKMIYDDRGNLNSVINNGIVEKTFKFDGTNMMESATSNKGTVNYSYDGLRNRVKSLIKYSPEELKKDVQKANDPMKEIRYILDLTKPYNNMLVKNENNKATNFTWDFGVISGRTKSNKFYYSLDELGSTMKLTNKEGRLLEPYGFNEFGVNIAENDFDENPFGFTGYQEDEISGLNFSQARYYGQGEGRFISEDLIKGFTSIILSTNCYLYCLDAPLKYIDPNGLTPLSDGTAAHNQIESNAAIDNPGKIVLLEPTINGGIPWSQSGNGRADIVIINNGQNEVYEIKSAGSYYNYQNNWLGMFQQQAYIQSLQSQGTDAVAGTSYAPLYEQPFVGDPENEILYVFTDHSRDPGMIYYQILPANKKDELDAKIANELAPSTITVPALEDRWGKLKDILKGGAGVLAILGALALFADDSTGIGVADDGVAAGLMGWGLDAVGTCAMAF